MFGMHMKCKQQKVCDETIEGLKKRFENLVAVNCIKAEGTLDGTFQIIFGRAGLFILAGAIAMPEQMTSLLEKCVGPANIQKNIKSGSLTEAEAVKDTLAEAGNLLVGCWDRVFREGLEGHGHLVQTNTFIGEPWDDPEEKIGLAGDAELLFVSYDMTIEPYPPFECSVIFPETIFDKTKAEEKIKAEAEAKVRTEAEAKAKAEAETKAKAEEKAKAEAELRAKAEAEARAKIGAEENAKTEAEETSETEEKTTAPDQSQEFVEGGVSETIQKMTQSPAVLPGESGKPTMAHISVPSTIRAKDVMRKDVVWASPDKSVQQALTKMQQHDSGYIMIGKDGTLEGIVSKSDITGATSIYLRPIFAKWHGPGDDATLQIKLKWIMSRPVRMIRPETPLAAIIENMHRFSGRCLPVMGREGKVQGLVTVFDIFKVLQNSNPNISTVGKSPQAPPLVRLGS